MKKIIGIIHPFDLHQTVYVYEDGNKLQVAQPKMDEITDVILQLAQQYDVKQINLSGAKHFAQGLIKKIQQEEFTKYNHNQLIINCI